MFSAVNAFRAEPSAIQAFIIIIIIIIIIIMEGCVCQIQGYSPITWLKHGHMTQGTVAKCHASMTVTVSGTVTQHHVGTTKTMTMTMAVTHRHTGKSHWHACMAYRHGHGHIRQLPDTLRVAHHTWCWHPQGRNCQSQGGRQRF